MGRRVVVRLSDRDDPAAGRVSRVEFLNGAQHAGRDAGRGARYLEVVALVPSVDVLLARVRLPPTRRSRLLKAVPYALEDALAEDVERLHFAVGEAGGANGVPVAVTARERMQHWLSTLDAAGLRPTVMLPDVLAIPYSANTLSILLSDEGALVRSGDCDGFGIETDQLDEFLPRLDSVGVHCYDARSRSERCGLPPTLAAGGLLSHEVRRGGAGEWMLEEMQSRASHFNLLQGGFPRPHRAPTTGWSWAAALLLALVASRGAVSALETRELRVSAERLYARIDSEYARAVPAELLADGVEVASGVTIDGANATERRARMQRMLATMRARHRSRNDDVLILLGAYGAAAEEVPDLRLDRVDFEQSKLELQLSAPGVEAFERLRRALETRPGLAAEIVSATSQGDSVSSRIRITGVP